MISAWLEGDQETIARFTLFSGNLREQLQKTVKKLTMDLTKHVKQDKLSGQVLNRRPNGGRLSRSITPSFEMSADSAVGIVGTNVDYGRYWELGFDRKVGAGARGGPRQMLEKAKAAYFAKYPPGMKHYGPRSFLGSALDDMRPKIKADIEQAVRTTTSNFFKI